MYPDPKKPARIAYETTFDQQLGTYLTAARATTTTVPVHFIYINILKLMETA